MTITTPRLTKPQAWALTLAARSQTRWDGKRWVCYDARVGVTLIHGATMAILLHHRLLTWARAWRLEDCVATLTEAGRDWLEEHA